MYQFQKRQVLSVATRLNRKERGWELLKRLSDGTRPFVIWTDEKIFTVERAYNEQNDCVLAVSLEDVPVHLRTAFKRKHPDQVMVFVGRGGEGSQIAAKKHPLWSFPRVSRSILGSTSTCLRTRSYPGWTASIGSMGMSSCRMGPPLTPQKPRSNGCLRICRISGPRKCSPPPHQTWIHGLLCVGYSGEEGMPQKLPQCGCPNARIDWGIGQDHPRGGACHLRIRAAPNQSCREERRGLRGIIR